MSRFPIRSDMPGLSNVQVSLHPPVPSSGTATVVDTAGKSWALSYGMAGPALTMEICEDGAICSFEPWAEYPDHWSAIGLVVNTERVGLASGFYRCALLLMPYVGGRYISPSDNVTPSGRGLWSKLDPSIVWEPVETSGGFRLDLTGRSAP